MTVHFRNGTRQTLEAALEAAYPKEGAGLLLGHVRAGEHEIEAVLTLPNRFAAEEQHHRFLLSAEDMLAGELEAEQRGLEVIGVFHSHPDHPAEPSTYDREHAWPWFLYTITTVAQGRAMMTRAWELREDRSSFVEHTLDGGRMNIHPSSVSNLPSD
jgi:proteasome lid subunit RPN8/RPN11